MSEAAPNHFERFGLPVDFQLDLPALSRRYREQAALVHPDRFVRASEAEQRHALSETASLNAAFQTLKSPASRALYLLSLSGQPLPLEATIEDGEFLFQQMQWHEELQELQEQQDAAALAAFQGRLGAAETQLGAAFAACWREPGQRAQAEKLARRLQFFNRLHSEVQRLEERLDA